ncbi:hypothetical protein BD560DRAFT_468030 [Blakeslea trispora]|nr:hypothetical protein BD560DRAFT_468030 [Blakeslea trispora]
MRLAILCLSLVAGLLLGSSDVVAQSPMAKSPTSKTDNVDVVRTNLYKRQHQGLMLAALKKRVSMEGQDVWPSSPEPKIEKRAVLENRAYRRNRKSKGYKRKSNRGRSQYNRNRNRYRRPSSRYSRNRSNRYDDEYDDYEGENEFDEDEMDENEPDEH